jgi:ribosomal protein L7/L12
MTGTVIVIIVVVAVVYLLSPDGLSESDRAALTKLEVQTERVLRALGVDWEEEVGVAVTKELLAVFDQWEREPGSRVANVPPAERMFEAIQLYRRLAGVGLWEAKERVGVLADQIKMGENRYVPRARLAMTVGELPRTD